MLRRDSADVTSAILPTRNVDLTSLPIARIVLILKAELFLRTAEAAAGIAEQLIARVARGLDTCTIDASHTPPGTLEPVPSRNSEHLETMGYYGRSR